MSKRVELSEGQVFGLWTVLRRGPDIPRPNGSVRSSWVCRCSCGQEKAVQQDHLRSEASQSCGCRVPELTRAAVTTHGESQETPEYRTWKAIKDRCLRPGNTHFAHYGGRGISICPEWRESFEAFLAHVGRKPSSRHSIDRIDNDRGYEPGNVRWSLPQAQARNKSDSVYLTHPETGERLTLAEWKDRAEAGGVKRATLAMRLWRGATLPEALRAGRAGQMAGGLASHLAEKLREKRERDAARPEPGA